MELRLIGPFLLCGILLILAAGCGQKAAPDSAGGSLPPPRAQGKSAPPEVQSEFKNAPGANGAAPATH